MPNKHTLNRDVFVWIVQFGYDVGMNDTLPMHHIFNDVHGYEILATFGRISRTVLYTVTFEHVGLRSDCLRKHSAKMFCPTAHAEPLYDENPIEFSRRQLFEPRRVVRKNK